MLRLLRHERQFSDTPSRRFPFPPRILPPPPFAVHVIQGLQIKPRQDKRQKLRRIVFGD
jgi:hypothetical protein